jgi:hypothetical protein
MICGKEKIFEEFIDKLTNSIDSTCIVALRSDDEHPDLVGVPLEILDKRGDQLIVSTGNLEVANSGRREISTDNIEIFYSETLIRDVFSKHFLPFLDMGTVREYNGFKESSYAEDDPDFY